MRALAVLALTIGLAGCGFGAQREHQQLVAAGMQQWQEANLACGARYSEDVSNAMARARCLNSADENLKQAILYPYPDLINLRMAKRIELAEKAEAGKITRAQMVLEWSQLLTQLASEEQRRSDSGRSVRAQEVSAQSAAASTPNPYTVPAANPCPVLVGGRCR